METDEAISAEGRLRTIASKAGLDWVVDEFERSVSSGVQVSPPTEPPTTDSPLEARPKRGRKKKDAELTTYRAVTAPERVVELARAMKRALFDVPELADWSLRELGPASADAKVESIRFVDERRPDQLDLRSVRAPEDNLRKALDALIELAKP